MVTEQHVEAEVPKGSLPPFSAENDRVNRERKETMQSLLRNAGKLAFPFTHYVIWKTVARRRWKDSSLLFNVVNHSALCSLAAFTFFKDRGLSDPWFGYSRFSMHKVVLVWLKYFLAYDFVKMVLGRNKDFLMYVHHVLAFYLFEILDAENFGLYYMPIIALFEVSSIPLNIREVLVRRNYPSEGNAVKITEAAFVISFLWVRLVFGFKHIAKAVISLQNEYRSGNINKEKTFRLYAFPTAMFVTFVALHALWMKGIIRQVKSAFT